MSLIQYNRQDFFDIKENYEVQDEIFTNYEEILNLINIQLFQNNKYNSKGGREWRKKKLPSFLERHVSEEDKLKNSINFELNKLSVENYRSIFNSIKSILDNIPDDRYTEIISLIIDSVFEKAVIQPVYCPYYVKLVFLLVNKNNRSLIMTLLRNKCTIYHQILTKKIDGNDIDKVNDMGKNNEEDEKKYEKEDEKKGKTDNNDNKTPEELEQIERQAKYDELCRQNLRKDYKKGFSQFVGELYNYDIITTREILFFYKKMLSNIANGLIKKEVDEDFIEDNIIYFEKLIEVSLKKLVSAQRKNMGQIHQISRNIDNITKGHYISRISGRLKFKMRDCHDLMRSQIKRRN